MTPGGPARGGPARGPSRRRVLAQVTREDLLWAGRHLVVHAIGGSWLMPRAGRYALYRAAGIRTEATNIFAGLTILGPLRNVRIGPGAALSTQVYLDSAAEIEIGPDTMVGPGTRIITSDHPLLPDGSVALDPVPRPVRIGAGVWIGANATLLPGITVGDGAVIAAGAVVTRDCEPRGVYAGVPAKLIRRLGPAAD